MRGRGRGGQDMMEEGDGGGKSDDVRLRLRTELTSAASCMLVASNV